MSAKNPLTTLKSRIYALRTTAYRIKHLTEMGQTVDYIHDELVHTISPKLITDAIKAWIRDLITSKIEQTSHEQLDFWKGDFYYPNHKSEMRWTVDYVGEDGKEETDHFATQSEAQDRAESYSRLGVVVRGVEQRMVKTTTEIHLSDLGVEEIDQIDQRKEANIKRAINELDRFRRYARIIRPILMEHPDWRWGDAVRWLESQGPLPDLG